MGRRMPREVCNQLSAAAVRQLKAPGRHADGNGLYLHISESGARWWVWRGTVHGRRREIGMGSARLVPLVEARERAIEWRRIARAGGDPQAARDQGRREVLSVEAAARRVFADQIAPHAKNAKHRAQWLEACAFPLIGARAVAAVAQADILRVLAPIWTEKPETAGGVCQRLRTVMDWARTAGHCEGVNPVEGVERGLPRQRDKVRHHAALPWGDVPALMARLRGVDGMGALALRFAILTAARSGEVRGATWSEIDLEAAVWTVPAERMKAGEAHRVPLSSPALGILGEVQGLSDGLVFPGTRPGKPLSA